MARKDDDIQKFCYHVNVTSHFSSLSKTDFVYRYIHTYSTPVFKPLIHRVALKSYNISLRKEHNDTKERKKGRKSERRKGKKEREKAQREKVRLMACVSKDRDSPFQFFEKVLPVIF